MVQIKFGTDGWRAIIAREYTEDNVMRVAAGTAAWMKTENFDKVVIGHDTRFGGQMFAEATCRVLASYGIKCFLARGAVSTPMVSLGVVKMKAHLGVVITASHNPPSYNGYKLKSKYGGPSIPSEIAAVEALIPDTVQDDIPALVEVEERGLVEYIDLEEMYYQHVMDHFDVEAMRNSNMKIAYDAMYGAGQAVMKRILPDAIFLHCDDNPGFKGQAPEPIHRNLEELSELIASDDSIQLGLANDGDADRIGMYDDRGNFVDSHHILMLLLYYMYEHKKMSGKVVVTFSVTDKMERLARHYGLDVLTTKIGFKYIAEIMREETVIVGGEESGGLAVAGHIPERDGIWVGLLVLEFMAKTGKSLRQLIAELYEKVGSFAFHRDDLHLDNDKKWEVVKKCKEGVFDAFGPYKIDRTEDLDGVKFLIGDDRWVLIRPSGTEPVLRVYAQAPNDEAVRDLLDNVHSTVIA